jgi:hypothetical protein
MTGKELIKIIREAGADKEIRLQRASMIMEVRPCDIRIDEDQNRIVITQ